MNSYEAGQPIRMVFSNWEYSDNVTLWYYKYKPLKRWFSWIQTKCWEWLCATGAVTKEYNKQCSVTNFLLDPKQLVSNLIYKAKIELFRRNVTPSKLFIGYTDFSRLMDEELPHFNLVPPQGFNFHLQVMNLEVTIVPHMEGILVL